MTLTSKTSTFLLIIYPEDKSPAGLKNLFSSFAKAVEATTGHKPQIVHPNKETIALLIEGEFESIRKTLLATSTQEIRWFLTQISLPCETFGLSAASAWLQTRSH